MIMRTCGSYSKAAIKGTDYQRVLTSPSCLGVLHGQSIQPDQQSPPHFRYSRFNMGWGSRPGERKRVEADDATETDNDERL